MSGKRAHISEEGDRPPKRPRAEQQPPVIEEINFARQLQQALTFSQDGTQQLRNGIASFKAFLESILYHKDEENRARQLSILREYLDTQKQTTSNAPDTPFLTQLWQAWSFGSSNHDDYLISSIASVLALLLKTVSSVLDFREHGLLLCRAVIQNQNLRLLKRSLDAPKHKEHVISPCLRLLTEVTSFDGGVLAREVYKRREQTFDIATLRRILGLRKTDATEEEARRRPSLRTQALRYIIQHLKYLHEGGKVDVLKNRGLCSAMFQHLRDDPEDVIVDLLSTIEQSILKQDELPRSTKSAVLTAQNLSRITEVATRNEQENAASQLAFRLLTSICKTPSYGILRPYGWYAQGTTETDSTTKDVFVSDGQVFARSDEEWAYNVRNTTLLAWLQDLRPHSNPNERELFLATLTAAPELVAAYIAGKTISMEPKLSNTWIGLASMLFEIVRLPVPEFLGNGNGWSTRPPPATVMIESVLPRPLTQKVLVRCLNQSSDLISYFSIRILIIAFQKLKIILNTLKKHAPESTTVLWTEAADLLAQIFIERCPRMKDIIAVFRQTPDDTEHVLQREAVVRLLRLYYEVIPLQALEEQFDVSNHLTSALLRDEDATDSSISPEIRQVRILELEHLLTISQFNPGTRWFHKGSLRYSPILTLLRMHKKDTANTQMRDLITGVLIDNGIVTSSESSASKSASNAFIASVLDLDDAAAAWDLIENCIGRASRQPIKYVDEMEAMSTEGADLPSIFIAVVVEQAAFVASEKSADAKASKVGWIERYLSLVQATPDNGDVLAKLLTSIQNTLGKKFKTKNSKVDLLFSRLRIAEPSQVSTGDDTAQAEEDLRLPFEEPLTESDNYSAMLRWSQKDLDLAVEDGDFSTLILYLCSQHSEIRRQALAQINKAKLLLRAATSMENSAQLSLVLCEVSETFEQQYLTSDKAMPYLTGTFAARAFRVQSQPASDIYPKINRFLIRGPEWISSRLPSYWLSNTVLGLPEEDDAYWREVGWVLEWLVDGLRTPEDLDILRRGNVFEKTMALARSPGSATSANVKSNVFELLFRATCIEGGALVLVTRAGVLSWLDIMQARDSDRRICTALRQRIVDRCDQERLQAWIVNRSKVAKA